MKTTPLLKKLLLLGCILLSINGALAQTQNPTWSLPPYSENIQLLSPMKGLPAGFTQYYTDNAVHNLIADASGKPLFFIVNGSVYDSTGGWFADLTYNKQLAEYWTGLPDVCSGTSGTYGSYLIVAGAQFNAISGFTEVCLVQNPANCKQYYIFTSGQTGLNGSINYSFGGKNDGTWGDYQIRYGQFYPFYTVIDLSLTNINGTPGVLQSFAETNDSLTGGYSTPGCIYAPYGSPYASKTTVTDYYNVKNLTPLLYPNITPFTASTFYAATPVIHGSGGNYNLVFHSDGYHISVMKLTGTGGTPLTLLHHDSIASSSTRQDAVGEMEVVRLSNKNFRVAVTYIESTYGFPAVYLADYDSTGAKISGSSSTIRLNNDYSYIHGIELTPGGGYILISHETTSADPGNLYYVTLSTPLSGAVTASSSNNISNSTPNMQYSQIELNYQSTTPYMYFADSNKVISLNVNGSPPWSTWNTSAATFPSNYSKTIVTTSYILPDQIDGGSYPGSAGSPTACCIFYSGYDVTTYNAINTFTGGYNQTWSSGSNPLNNGAGSTVTIGEELRIPAGYTVTINNMTLKFSPQARLIIENGKTSYNGGSLILNNCTLKVDNRCVNDMWPGVQVWGTPGNTHGFAYQGSLVLNSSQIQDAYVAVCVGYNNYWYSAITADPGAPYVNSANFSLGIGLGSYPGGGGVFQATSTTFLNNYLGLALYTYTNSAYPTNNVITQCSFLVNAALLAPSVTPAYHILLENNTEGFYVVGSSFNDTHYLQNDYGIYSYNSNFNVGDYYGSPPRSKFTNMQYGIYALNSSGNSATMSCIQSTFKSNYYGIYLGYVDNTIIETDSFNVFGSNSVGGHNSYGLYLDNSTSYSVRDNLFYGNGKDKNHTYGIIANNAPHDNIIFRNIFKSLNVGNQSQFQNYIWSSTSPQNGINGGLQYLCNTFTTGGIRSKDIYVAGNLASDTITYTGTSHPKNAGIDYWQGTGSSGYPATGGNRFSHTSGGYGFYIDTVTNNTYNSTYRYYCPSGTCSSSSIYPFRFTSQLGVSPSTTDSTDCTHNPYTCPNCRTANENQAMLNEADGYLQTYQNLKAQIDGGSTSGLLSLVQGNNNSQSVYNSLNAAAPNLSDDVLKAYINSSYPASDITQILTSCSPLTDEVNKAVNASNLSSTTISQLGSLQVGMPKMFQLYSNISAAFSSRQLILDELIRGYVHDSIQTNVQQGYALMKVKALELPARTQVEIGLNLNDTTMATNALTQVANEEGQSNYVKLNTILLQNIGKPTWQIMSDASVVSALQAMAIDSSDRLTYLKVHALLRANGLSNYQPYIILDNSDATGSQDAERTVSPQQETITSVSTLVNQPNPFKESTTIKAVIVEKTQNAYIVITDMVGNEVARYPVQQGENSININAGNLNQAVMFCTLVVDGVKIKTNKMVLIK